MFLGVILLLLECIFDYLWLYFFLKNSKKNYERFSATDDTSKKKCVAYENDDKPIITPTVIDPKYNTHPIHQHSHLYII